MFTIVPTVFVTHAAVRLSESQHYFGSAESTPQPSPGSWCLSPGRRPRPPAGWPRRPLGLAWLEWWWPTSRQSCRDSDCICWYLGGYRVAKWRTLSHILKNKETSISSFNAMILKLFLKYSFSKLCIFFFRRQDYVPLYILKSIAPPSILDPQSLYLFLLAVLVDLEGMERLNTAISYFYIY